jgi:hypothetical protein
LRASIGHNLRFRYDWSFGKGAPKVDLSNERWDEATPGQREAVARLAEQVPPGFSFDPEKNTRIKGMILRRFDKVLGMGHGHATRSEAPS